MTSAVVSDELRLGWLQRTTLGVVGGTLLSLLAMAAWLRPDPSGLGTHQQLGLPPCSFRVLLQIRCPACGMTTSWSHVVRGQLWSACRANVGGTLLALVAIIVGPWSLLSASYGRCLGKPPAGWLLLVVTLAVVLVTLVDWTGRIAIAKWSNRRSAFSIQTENRGGLFGGRDGPSDFGMSDQLCINGWVDVRRIVRPRGIHRA